MRRRVRLVASVRPNRIQRLGSPFDWPTPGTLLQSGPELSRPPSLPRSNHRAKHTLSHVRDVGSEAVIPPSCVGHNSTDGVNYNMQYLANTPPETTAPPRFVPQRIKHYRLNRQGAYSSVVSILESASITTPNTEKQPFRSKSPCLSHLPCRPMAEAAGDVLRGVSALVPRTNTPGSSYHRLHPSCLLNSWIWPSSTL